MTRHLIWFGYFSDSKRFYPGFSGFKLLNRDSEISPVQHPVRFSKHLFLELIGIVEINLSPLITFWKKPHSSHIIEKDGDINTQYPLVKLKLLKRQKHP